MEINTGFINNIMNRIFIVIVYIIIFIFSFMVVIFGTKKVDMGTPILVILLFCLSIIIFNTMGNNILSISVSPTTNPVPPHNGLNGISLKNLFAGINI